MSQLLITTRKTNMLYIIAGAVESFLYIIVGVFLSRFNGTASCVMYIVAFVNFLIKLSFSTSYIDVYADKMVGKGIHQLTVRDFDLNYEQIDEISCVGRFVHITTAGIQYKVVTSVEKAKEIYNYYNQSK